MFLKINENTYIAISTVTKIKIIKDIHNEYMRVFADEKQYDIAKNSEEFAVAMKFVEQNTFIGVTDHGMYYTSKY